MHIHQSQMWKDNPPYPLWLNSHLDIPQYLTSVYILFFYSSPPPPATMEKRNQRPRHSVDLYMLITHHRLYFCTILRLKGSATPGLKFASKQTYDSNWGLPKYAVFTRIGTNVRMCTNMLLQHGWFPTPNSAFQTYVLSSTCHNRQIININTRIK